MFFNYLDEVLLFIKAGQFTTVLIGVAFGSSGDIAIRKRWPSARTSYGGVALCGCPVNAKRVRKSTVDEPTLKVFPGVTAIATRSPFEAT